MQKRLMSFLWCIFLMTSVSQLAIGGQPRHIKINQEQTQGQVRVILLRVSQLIVSNQPNFVVTYAVEIPVKGAFADLHFGRDKEIALSAGGKALHFPDSVSSSSMGFKELPRQHELIKPKIREGKAMLAQEVVISGLKVTAPRIDVTIQFSWRDTPLKFDFKGVPLN